MSQVPFREANPLFYLSIVFLALRLSELEMIVAMNCSQLSMLGPVMVKGHVGACKRHSHLAPVPPSSTATFSPRRSFNHQSISNTYHLHPYDTYTPHTPP